MLQTLDWLLSRQTFSEIPVTYISVSTEDPNKNLDQQEVTISSNFLFTDHDFIVTSERGCKFLSRKNYGLTWNLKF